MKNYEPELLIVKSEVAKCSYLILMKMETIYLMYRCFKEDLG